MTDSRDVGPGTGLWCESVWRLEATVPLGLARRGALCGPATHDAGLRLGKAPDDPGGCDAGAAGRFTQTQ